MKVLRGYWRTIRGYLATCKGRHDFFDYLQAFLLIALTIAGIYIVMFFLVR